MEPVCALGLDMRGEVISVGTPHGVFSPHDVTLMQFTGLNVHHDRTGVDVYEHDIVETEYGLAVVQWSHSEKGWWLLAQGDESTSFKHRAMSLGSAGRVVGNIHANPDLIR